MADAKLIDDSDLKAQHVQRTTLLGTLALAWGTLGVIYGDIGTSPLYVYATIFSSLTPSKDDVLGAVSLIFWTLTLVVLIKYVGIVMMANDDGEGGTFALYSLLCRKIGIKPHSTLNSGESQQMRALTSLSRTSSFLRGGTAGGTAGCGSSGDRPWWQFLSIRSSSVRRAMRRSRASQYMLWFLTMAATGMVLGDGVLTPAISVMSAVYGLTEASPAVTKDVVVGVSIAILVVLFSVQRFGTSKVSFTFAPIVALWLAANLGVAIYNLTRYGGEVLQGLSPHYIVKFFQNHGSGAWRMLGGVMLCVTGAEALFADMGHFSHSAVMIGFGTYAYPCLAMTYIGQGAFLINNPEDVGSTFWKSCPRAFFYPMLVLAALASVVASQALISGSFSIMSNAIRLGCFPKLPVLHTSATVRGQIYVPAVNWVLMILCVAVVAGFQDTVQLGNAYGLTVSTVFIITTLLVVLVMLAVWQLSLLLVLPFAALFLLIEGAFVSANAVKVPDGGWFSLAVSAGVVYVMVAWWLGSRRRQAALACSVRGDLADLFVVLPRPPPPAVVLGTPTPGSHSSTTHSGGAAGEATALGYPAASQPPLPIPTGPSAAQQCLEIAAASTRPSSAGTPIGPAASSVPLGAAALAPRSFFAALSTRLATRKPLQLALRLPAGDLYPLARQPGIGIYYNDDPAGLPHVLLHCLKNMRGLHDVSVFMTVRYVPIPHVRPEECLLVRQLHPLPNFYQVVSRYGYLDTVDHGPAFVSRVVDAVVRLLRTPQQQQPVLAAVGASGERDGLVGRNDDNDDDDSSGAIKITVVDGTPEVQLPEPNGNGASRLATAWVAGELSRPLTRPAGAAAATAAAAAQLVDEDAVVHILEAVKEGAVYYFGAVRARPDPCTPLYRDVLYGSLYRGLQALSHSEVEDWQVPYDNVVELGVVVHL